MVIIALAFILTGSLLLGSKTARERYFFAKLRWGAQHVTDYTPAHARAIQRSGAGLILLGLLALAWI